MGYTTEFQGCFDLDKELDGKTFEFLRKFNQTRRMARRLPSTYGVEGEFYVDGSGDFGQDKEDNIMSFNIPPSTQPGLWCQWTPTYDKKGIEWDGGEKFHHYIEWIEYIIDKILAPRGYTLNGEVAWRGGDFSDNGTIVVKDNVVITRL